MLSEHKAFVKLLKNYRHISDAKTAPMQNAVALRDRPWGFSVEQDLGVDGRYFFSV